MPINNRPGFNQLTKSGMNPDAFSKPHRPGDTPSPGLYNVPLI